MNEIKSYSFSFSLQFVSINNSWPTWLVSFEVEVYLQSVFVLFLVFNGRMNRTFNLVWDRNLSMLSKYFWNYLPCITIFCRSIPGLLQLYLPFLRTLYAKNHYKLDSIEEVSIYSQLLSLPRFEEHQDDFTYTSLI